MGKQNSEQTITFLNNLHPVKAQEKITAVFEFNPRGKLKNVFLNTENEMDRFVLKRGLERLLVPSKSGWFRRLFR